VVPLQFRIRQNRDRNCNSKSMRKWRARNDSNVRAARFVVKLGDSLRLDHSSYLFAGARQSFRAQAKPSLLLAALCIVIAVSGGSSKDRR
jgi:hypothetical protein